MYVSKYVRIPASIVEHNFSCLDQEARKLLLRGFVFDMLLDSTLVSAYSITACNYLLRNHQSILLGYPGQGCQ